MAQINISLPPALMRWVGDQVSAGRFSSASDFIRSLVRDDEERAAELAWLQAAIDKGRSSPIIDRDGFEVLDEIIAEGRAAHGENRTAA